MFGQIQDAQVRVRAREFGNPGVTAALWHIREQLEGHTGRRNFPISVCKIKGGS